MHGGGIGLRDLHIEPQPLRVGNAEQLRTGAASGIDELTDIGIAGGDDAVERRDDPLEARQLTQALDVCLGRLHLRISGRCQAELLIRLLL